MKTIAIAMTALLATCASVQAQQNVCSGVAIFAATTSSMQLVAGVAGKHVELCGWYASNNTDVPNPKLGTVQLIYGTGQNCATNSGALTPPIRVESWIINSHQYTLEQAPAGASLCLKGSGTVPTITGAVYYGLF